MYSLTIFVGGYEGSYTVDTILEYDITGDSDSYIQTGTMIHPRDWHAISVVKYEDFSQWCE